MKSSAFFKLMLDLPLWLSLRSLSLKNQLQSSNPPTLKRGSLCTGSSTTATFHSSRNSTCWTVMTGCHATNSEASSTAWRYLLPLSSFSLSSVVNLSCADLLAQCCPWLTSCAGAMFGVTKTGGDAQKKSSLLTRSSPAPEASSQ